MLNQQIGSYKIISKLGEGGMAHVYLAEKGALKKKVALKVLKRDFNSNRYVRGRFLSEPKKMVNLNHPNIVAVHDLIDQPDFVAIELEYVQGKTLKQYLNVKGALPDEEIEKLLPQMVDALQHIHKKGYIHRDVKPSNFMITEDGTVKLTDFGIAKNTEDAAQDYTGTATGMQMGTPKYMSPEQVRSTKNVTAQSDIYSLGVVLWEMVTGKVPYDIETESTFDVFRKIVDDPLTVTRTTWDNIISKATDKRPEKRFQNVTHLKDFGKITQPVEVSSRYNDFKTVKISNQVWMAENLNVDKFRNGEVIPQVKTAKEWERAGKNKQPAWCYYDNNSKNATEFGKLYNWYAVNDPRGLAPDGWKIPSIDELSRLERFKQSTKSTIRKIQSQNSNYSELNSVFCGYRHCLGYFYDVNLSGMIWSSSNIDEYSAWCYDIQNITEEADVDNKLSFEKGNGAAVRCIKSF